LPECFGPEAVDQSPQIEEKIFSKTPLPFGEMEGKGKIMDKTKIQCRGAESTMQNQKNSP
jgi:hypothetical protein